MRCFSIRDQDGGDPQLELDTSVETNDGSWESEWSVSDHLDNDTPCFILYRLDDKDAGDFYLWVLISWSPGNILNPDWLTQDNTNLKLVG